MELVFLVWMTVKLLMIGGISLIVGGYSYYLGKKIPGRTRDGQPKIGLTGAILAPVFLTFLVMAAIASLPSWAPLGAAVLGLGGNMMLKRQDNRRRLGIG